MAGVPLERVKSEPAGTSRRVEEVAAQFVSDALAVPLQHLSDIGSWHAHVPFAYAFMAVHRPRLTVELGVHKGDSYLTMCRGILDHRIGGRAIGVDTWQGDSHAGIYNGDMILDELKHRHDPEFSSFSVLLRKTFDEALRDVEDGSVDLLHIDGFHTYEAVRRDFETWIPKLSRNGVVLFHDTTVRRDDFGVWKLWSEIRGKGPSYEFKYGNGLGLLAVGSDVREETRCLLRALDAYRVLEGLSLVQFLSRVGNAIADSIRVGVLDREVARVNGEWMDERRRTKDEFARLHDEIDRQKYEIRRLKEDLQFASSTTLNDISQLRGDIAQVRTSRNDDAANAEIGRLAAEIEMLKQAAASEMEVARQSLWLLTEEIAELRKSLAERRFRSSLLKGRNELRAGVVDTLMRARRLSQPFIRQAGRAVLAMIPGSPDRRVRVKNRLIRVFGHSLGIRASYVDTKFSLTVGGQHLRLPVPGDRYYKLSLCARGEARDAPLRSVSIVIPVFNQLAYTLDCLASVMANSTDVEHEIIVVDDCSTDQTQAVLSDREGITYIRNDRNLGFIGSCNRGAAKARHNYLCFLNNDTRVLPNWLSALVNTFELHQHTGLAGSKLIYPDGRLQEAGGLIWNDGSGWNWGRLKDPADPRYNYARRTDYCSGASILVPRALFEGLGGFDTHYAPAYGEDSDLAFKIRSVGLSTVYQPLSQVVHFEGVTSGTDISSGVKKYQVDNAAKLAARWAPYLRDQGISGVNADVLCDRGVIGRILVIDQITPEPDRDAGSITALEIMRALRDLGYKITFVPCSNYAWLAPYSELLASLGIESVVMPWADSLADHLSRFGSQYSAALIFRPHTWQDYINQVRTHAPQARAIYHTSDLHFLRHEREHALDERESIPVSASKLDEARRAELDLIASADLCIVHSTVEIELLKDLRPASRVVCFPWIYEPRGSGPAFLERKDLIFVGGYAHPPNVDVAQYFISRIYPLILEELSDVRFVSAGSFPPPALQAAASERVIVPGYVEDISPLLFDARVMVVPLRYGAGIKGKIISGLAHGLPVVTTQLGAEGMGLVHEEHVLIADGEAEFAAAVVRLYSDEDLWRKLSAAGLDYVRRTTSRAAGLGIVAGFLEELGLPHLPQGRSADCDPIRLSEFTAFGSNPAVFDLSSLARVALRHAGGPVASGIIGVVGNVKVTEASAEGLKFVSLDEAKQAQHTAKFLAIIADSTDEEEVERIARFCKNDLALGSSAAVVFVPPRLTASGDGYVLRAPFSERAARPQPMPVHERWATAFGSERHRFEWVTDKSLTGFPSICLVRFTAIDQ